MNSSVNVYWSRRLSSLRMFCRTSSRNARVSGSGGSGSCPSRKPDRQSPATATRRRSPLIFFFNAAPCRPNSRPDSGPRRRLHIIAGSGRRCTARRNPDAPGPRLPPFVDRPEDRHGRHRRVLFGFVVVHMIGNLQVYLGPDGDQRVRRVPAGDPARRGPLDRARGAAGRRRRCTSGRPWSLTRTTATARPVGYRERQRRESTLRLAHDALERRDRARLHRLPPARTSRSAHVHPELRARATSTTTSSRASASCRCRRLLHGRDGRCSACTCTTALEHAADARRLPPALRRGCGQRAAVDRRAVIVARQHLVPAGRARRRACE